MEPVTNIFPVITLYQPWATWIMRGWKTIETRTHNRFKCLEHRFILIHAGMNTDNTPWSRNNPYLTEQQIYENPKEMVNGYILGTAYVQAFSKLEGTASKRALIDCEIVDRWGLYLVGVRKFEEPIKCNGSMGIWYYDLDKKEKVKINN